MNAKKAGLTRSLDEQPNPLRDRLREAIRTQDAEPLRCEGLDPHARLQALLDASLGSPADLPAAKALALAHPTAVTHAILAGQHLVAGWVMHSPASSTKANDPRPVPFEDHVDIAERSLVRAAEMDPAEPLVHVLAMTVSRTHGHRPEVARAHFDRAQAALPWSVPAVRSAVQAFAPKWGGSEEALVALAEELIASAPAGSPALSGVPNVVIELWIDGMLSRDKRANPLDDGPRTTPFERPELRSLIERAAARSIDAPEWPGDSDATAFALNLFAFTAFMMNDRVRATALFDRLDGVYTEWPWRHLGKDSRAVYERSRIIARGEPLSPEAGLSRWRGIATALAPIAALVGFALLVAWLLSHR